jgi:neopullulanase
MHGLYEWPINFVQLNLLDSHDMARALWIMGDDPSALRLCVLFQMTMPGAPCIYYGDEIGLSSAGDPDCRAAFPWHQPDTWDHDLLAFYGQAMAMRHTYPVLRTGSFQTLCVTGGVYAFRRRLDRQEAIIIFNTATEPASLTLAVPQVEVNRFEQVWPVGTDLIFEVREGQLEVEVPAREAAVLVSQA